MQTQTPLPADVITRDADDADALHRATSKMFVFEGSSDQEWYVWFILASNKMDAKRKMYEDYNSYYESFEQFCAAMFDRNAPRIRCLGKGYLRFENGFPFLKSEFITQISECVTRIGGGR